MMKVSGVIGYDLALRSFRTQSWLIVPLAILLVSATTQDQRVGLHCFRKCMLLILSINCKGDNETKCE